MIILEIIEQFVTPLQDNIFVTEELQYENVVLDSQGTLISEDRDLMYVTKDIYGTEPVLSIYQ